MVIENQIAKLKTAMYRWSNVQQQIKITINNWRYAKLHVCQILHTPVGDSQLHPPPSQFYHPIY